jgi:aspartokinase
MIKIQDVVEQIVIADPEALVALTHAYMNLSAYAKRIHTKVERRCKKKILVQGITVALSRLQTKLSPAQGALRHIHIDDITIKTPLTELVFKKTESLLKKISLMYGKIKISRDEFLTMTQSTSEVSIICSQRITQAVLRIFEQKPTLAIEKLASIGLTLNPKYYKEPNVTYSLLHKIAQHKIVLAETITTHTEIIFVFPSKDLEKMVRLFS